MGKKYALIVGVSDYKDISDLRFCDEDATDWYRYLKERGYEITLLGDVHRGNYPKYDGLATETNVRSQLRRILQEAKSDDTVVFVTAGHGKGDGKGNSYLCYVNYNKGQDCYSDKELLEDLRSVSERPNVFIFIDHCFAGGFLDELKTIPKVACLATCSKNGYGYDFARGQNGAWTYTFLEKGMNQQFGGSAPVEKVFKWAKDNYVKVTGRKSSGDIPEMISNLGDDFKL